MDYVGEEALKVVEYIETKLKSLPPQAGIIFVAVKAVPAPKGEVKSFEIRLGMMKQFEEATGMEIIKSLFKEEIEKGSFGLLASVFRGVPGAAAHDKGHAGAHSRPS